MSNEDDLMQEGLKIEAEIEESDNRFWGMLLLIVLMLAAGLILSACDIPHFNYNYSPTFV